MSSDKKSTKRNSHKRPFPAGKGLLCISPKGRGHSRFRCANAQTPLSILEAIACWALAHNRLLLREVDRSLGCRSRNIVSLKRVYLPPTAVILWEMFEFRSNAFRNITSVGDRLHHSSYTMPQQLDRGNTQTSRSPPPLCASAQRRRGTSTTRWVCVFAPQKRKNPILLK